MSQTPALSPGQPRRPTAAVEAEGTAPSRRPVAAVETTAVTAPTTQGHPTTDTQGSAVRSTLTGPEAQSKLATAMMDELITANSEAVKAFAPQIIAEFQEVFGDRAGKLDGELLLNVLQKTLHNALPMDELREYAAAHAKGSLTPQEAQTFIALESTPAGTAIAQQISTATIEFGSRLLGPGMMGLPDAALKDVPAASPAAQQVAASHLGEEAIAQLNAMGIDAVNLYGAALSNHVPAHYLETAASELVPNPAYGKGVQARLSFVSEAKDKLEQLVQEQAQATLSPIATEVYQKLERGEPADINKTLNALWVKLTAAQIDWDG
jgi:hypothetical protein